MVPTHQDRGPCLEMCWCHHLGLLQLSMVVQLSAGETFIRQSDSMKPWTPFLDLFWSFVPEYNLYQPQNHWGCMTSKHCWSFRGSSAAKFGTCQQMTNPLARVGEPGCISQETTVRLWNVVLCIDAGIGRVRKGKMECVWGGNTGEVFACLCVVPSRAGEHPGGCPVRGLGSAWGWGLEVEKENAVKKEKYYRSNDSVCGRIRFG